ncbi:phage head morphogenesis protein [Comamonas aquatica]|uniref:phage head morphogenesis protein n=1 Tax=Comamonas aquatica TaxID=225991 RepID=UPI00244AFCAE|nr:phage minor head protein [Comamonas aquatica]MDH0373707.1 phage head morphogenesis protein [Comamonas aquatica]
MSLDYSKIRREAIRWHLLSAVNLSRPAGIYTEPLLEIVRAVYPDATHQEVRVNLDYLEEREMVRITKDPMDRWSVTTFDPARLRLIYDTNTRQAYATGLWERVERAKRTHPYLRYITRRDGRVRHEHAQWDNLVLPVDHPFWKTHWPPNGWRCRCRVMSMSQAEYDRGYSIERQGAERDASAQGVYKRFNTQEPVVPVREYVNPRTGEVLHVPEGIDPGFAYNPGQARQQAMRQQIQSKLAAAVPALGQAAREAGLNKGE